MVQFFRVVVLLLGMLGLWSAGGRAHELYPTLGELVHTLSRELGWPTAATTEEHISALQAEHVIPVSLSSDQRATPTVVMILMRGLLQRSRARGEDADLVLSAMVRAAAASRAPIPTLSPEKVALLPQAVTVPATPLALEGPQSEAFVAASPVPLSPVVERAPGVAKPRWHRRQERLQQFPRTIFAPGQSPAEEGAGVFPRR